MELANISLTPFGKGYFRASALLGKAPKELAALPMDTTSGVDAILKAFAGFSTYLSRALLNHVFRGLAYAGPGTVYVALNASDPTDAGNNTELALTNGYGRVGVPSTISYWTAPGTAGSAEQIQNSQNVTYGVPTGDWNSGNPITWVSLWDALTSGNMLGSGALGTPRTVLADDNAPVFGPASLVISLA